MINRRGFFEESLIAAGLAAATQVATPLATAETLARSTNETIGHAVIGCRIRGRVHAREFARLTNVEVTYVCDPDRKLVDELATAVEEQTGRRPRTATDLRTVFDAPGVDTVSIAAPNHWHALAAVWAMRAGKDVYVEKPVSHNVEEGRKIVDAAEATNRICQAGTQNRSRGDLAAAAEYIRAGKLGRVELARTIVYGRRNAIGAKGTHQVPKHVDFNLWLGPAKSTELQRPNLHYDWHWVWDTGNGELGNNNIHYVDLCRWLLGLEGWGRSVVSFGGRVGYEDAGETPNTQVVVHDFPRDDGHDLTLIQEVRGLPSSPFSPHFKAGHVIHGTEGIIAEGTLFSPKGEKLKTFTGPNVNHFANFIDVVRSRDRNDLNADITEGHQSTSLCHIGNISYRLGQTDSESAIAERIDAMKLHPEVRQSFDRMVAHLKSNNVDLNNQRLSIGPNLTVNSASESFQDEAANQLLSREHRRPFVF